MHFWPFTWISVDNSHSSSYVYIQLINILLSKYLATFTFLHYPRFSLSMFVHEHGFPCLHCQPQDYIRMVQHLIERCLLFHMSRDDCIKALAKHANIHPVVTLTVWKELLKENKGFFRAYFNGISPRHSTSRAAAAAAGGGRVAPLTRVACYTSSYQYHK